MVKNRKTFTLESLQQYTPSRVVVSYFSGSQGLVTKTYLGVPLSDLLNEAEARLDSTQKNDSLRQYIVISATDCYEVIVALAEILPNSGGQQVLLAYADGEGRPLVDDEGMARLVLPGDKAGGRFITNIVSIVVRSAP
jgi:DMSO/TMAO reductase YedYZ molybdopterin-dependent catalytic subunit